jgi:hypothetical protein
MEPTFLTGCQTALARLARVSLGTGLATEQVNNHSAAAEDSHYNLVNCWLYSKARTNEEIKAPATPDW